jgi:hypothetical protein
MLSRHRRVVNGRATSRAGGIAAASGYWTFGKGDLRVSEVSEGCNGRRRVSFGGQEAAPCDVQCGAVLKVARSLSCIA